MVLGGCRSFLLLETTDFHKHKRGGDGSKFVTY